MFTRFKLGTPAKDDGGPPYFIANDFIFGAEFERPSPYKSLKWRIRVPLGRMAINRENLAQFASWIAERRICDHFRNGSSESPSVVSPPTDEEAAEFFNTIDPLRVDLDRWIDLSATSSYRAVPSAGIRQAANRVDTDTKDVFICHASEDKDDLGRPLARALESADVSVWFDEFELVLGDSLSERIEDGLRRARHGLVILSPNFFTKDWPQRELQALHSLAAPGRRILPIFHQITPAEVLRKAPLVGRLLGISSALGIARLVPEIQRALRKSHVPISYEDTLSTEEIEVLTLAAAQGGEIYKLSSDQIGSWVRIGGRDFVDESQPVSALTYVEALESLLRKKLAKHESGILYRLTVAGFGRAKDSALYSRHRTA